MGVLHSGPVGSGSVCEAEPGLTEARELERKRFPTQSGRKTRGMFRRREKSKTCWKRKHQHVSPKLQGLFQIIIIKRDYWDRNKK